MNDLLYTIMHEYPARYDNMITTHPFTELVYVLRGEGKIMGNKTSVTLGKGDVVLIPPDVTHREITEKSPLTIFFAGFFEKNPVFSADSMHTFTNLSYTPKLLLQTILKENNSPHKDKNEIISALLSVLLLFLRRGETLSTGKTVNGDCVSEAVTYMQQHPAQDIDLSGLSRRFNLNKNYFSAVFKKKTGVSPKRFQTALRIDVAQKMLFDSTRSIKEISEMVGFQDPYYFSRAFKKIAGMPPEAFRNALEK